MSYYDLMNVACENAGVNFNEDKYKLFLEYKNLIQEWNKKVNLTAITEDEEIIKKHFIDCIKVMSFEPLKNANSIIDVGTGAGFPGIPLKIISRDVKTTLLDSLNKRITFLNEVINNLELKNIEAIHGRAEEFGVNPEYREKYDIAISRAVANLTTLSEYCIPFVKKGGYFIAMKGPSVDEEILNAKEAIEILGGKLEEIKEVSVEGTDLNHNIVIIKKIKDTPRNLPRKSNMIGKKPLKKM